MTTDDKGAARTAPGKPLGAVSGAVSWEDFFALYATTDAPDDYMAEADRNQGEQTRDPFEGIEEDDQAQK